VGRKNQVPLADHVADSAEVALVARQFANAIGVLVAIGGLAPERWTAAAAKRSTACSGPSMEYTLAEISGGCGMAQAVTEARQGKRPASYSIIAMCEFLGLQAISTKITDRGRCRHEARVE
jgi:hypothetical protein